MGEFLVSPPDGDLTDFMQSCDKLGAIDATAYFPAHGAPIRDPKGRLAWLVGHRRAREAQIIDQLTSEDLTVSALTRQIYTDVAPALLPAATRNVLAHLIDLTGKSRVTPLESLHEGARFALTDTA